MSDTVRRRWKDARRSLVADSDRLADKRRVYEAIQARDVDALIGALVDPENRAWAATHLGKLGDERAVEPLIRLLRARDFGTRVAAAKALGKLRAREAIPALVESVDEGPEDVMRAWSIDALGKIGSDEVVPKLIETLGSEHRGLRRTAAAALAEIGDQEAIPALEEAASRESWRERRFYRQAIRRLKQTERKRA